MTSTYMVRSIDRAMRILETFDNDHTDRGVTEIAQLTGIHKATVHRILMTMMAGGFLERSPDGERFRLGRRIIELGLGALGRLDLRRIALPYMRQLVERFQETCDLGLYDRGRVLYVEVIHSGRSLSVAPLVGRRLPAYCSASGKAMLAFQPPDVIEEVLHEPMRQFTENTLTSPARLREELERIRERGYAVDNGELEAAIRAIAAPILNMDGYADAAIGLVGPASRLTIEAMEKMRPALVETAQAIAGQMPVRFTV